MVYGALAAMTVLTLVPIMSVAVVALVLFLLIFISLYIIRSKAETDSLVQNHMIYLIRTIWISSLWSLVTMTLASLYLLPKYNDEALQPCVNDVMGVALDNPGANTKDMSDAMQPCMDDFMSDNHDTFMTAALIGGGPVLLYFLFRLFKGGARAVKGYRLANPKGWF